MDEKVSVAQVSVVIPCYNCVSTIWRAVDSIATQVLLPKEVILVNDASPDEGKTENAIIRVKEKYQSRFEVKTIHLKENVGAGEARNEGWEKASQDYIAFLDADDSWHPDKLKIQYEWMIKHPECVLSGHQCSQSNKVVVSTFTDEEIHSKKITRLAMLKGNPFSTPTVMVKRNIPFRFQKGKRYAEDYLLWQEIFYTGNDLVKIEMPLAYVHKEFYGAGGLSSRLWAMEKGELETFFLLWKKKAFSVFILISVSVFSLTKFFKRLAVVAVKRVLGIKVESKD